MDEKISNASSSMVESETRDKLSGIRKVIAERMVNWKHTIPLVTLVDEVDVTDLVRLRKKHKNIATERGIKLTYLPYIVKSFLSAARKYPILNASIDDMTEEVVYKHYYNVGIAVDTDYGLIVPVIKNVDRKTMIEISDEINHLASKARNRKLTTNDMQGGTLTISNIGSAAGQWFTPIINHPQVAILGIGKIAEKPIIYNGHLEIRQILSLSLSFDHRLIDGSPAQTILNHIKRLLNNPQLLMMEE